VLVASSKFASKCRACQGTIDIGDSAWCARTAAPRRGPLHLPASSCRTGVDTPTCSLGHAAHVRARLRPPLSLDPWLPRSRFQRDGEPGRKTTCVACHQQKVAATGAVADPEKPADKPKKAIAKRPRPQTKVRRPHARLRFLGTPTTYGRESWSSPSRQWSLAHGVSLIRPWRQTLPRPCSCVWARCLTSLPCVPACPSAAGAKDAG
jgi:hypothetical protein